MAVLPLKSSCTEQCAVVRFNSRQLVWQRCHLNLPVLSSLPLFVLLWAKGHDAHAVHSEMRPVYGDKWPDEENAAWTEICLRYGGAMGRSSVACTAVRLHRAFTNLSKDGTNV